MPNWLNFILDACWRERGLIGRAIQGVSVTIPTAMALLVDGWRRADWPWWVWLCLFLGGLVLAVVIGVFRQAYQLWLERQPKVSITADYLVHPKGAVGRASRVWRLKLVNESTSHLKNCTVREDDFVNRFGHRSGLQRYFRLAEEGHADMSRHSFSKAFDLKGKGASQIVEIAFLDETTDESRVIMLYATSPTAQTLNACPRATFPHDLTIIFTSDDMSIPERKTYCLSISDDGTLRMEG